MDIDFVVTWVNSDTVTWKNNFRVAKGSDNLNPEYIGSTRFREEINFKFWFRMVERNCPWVRYIYVVTNGEFPEWLNKYSSKIKPIVHSDYIDSKFLPTFNSNAIELGLGKLPGLSENFVLFNDDMFVVKPIEKSFFFKQGFPVDEMIFYPMIPMTSFDHTMFNNMFLFNKRFSKNKVFEKNNGKIFSIHYGRKLIWQFFAKLVPGFFGFRNPHVPIAYNKSMFNEAYKCFKLDAEQTTSHIFRSDRDISHWLFRYYQLASGNWIVRSPKKIGYISLNELNLKKILKVVNGKSNTAVVCLNDDDSNVNNSTISIVNNKLQELYERKSDFEVNTSYERNHQ